KSLSCAVNFILSIHSPELWSVTATQCSPFSIAFSTHCSGVTVLSSKHLLAGECKCKSHLNHLVPLNDIFISLFFVCFKCLFYHRLHHFALICISLFNSLFQF